jgi:hypothetical protein
MVLQTSVDTFAMALQGYKKPAPMSVQHNYHITSQVRTARVHMPPAACCIHHSAFS